MLGFNAFGEYALGEVSDTTAPILTNASGTDIGATTASGSVTTNEAGGILYYLASTNPTATATAVMAGGSQAVAVVGSQTVSFSGLIGATTYYPHYVHVDAAKNVSAVANGASFTTQSTGPTVTGVTVTPASAIVIGGALVDFNWVILGTNNPSQGATVSTSLGTIDANGLLTAPATISTAQNGTVTVTSTQDPSFRGYATFTVPAAGTPVLTFSATVRYIQIRAPLGGKTNFK